MLLKRCFTGISTCLCGLNGCAGEESVGLYRQISTVKRLQPLITVNYNRVTSNSTTVHVKVCCGFVCDAVGLFNSVFSVHRLVLVTFFLIIHVYIHDTYYGVVEMMKVNKGRFMSVV